MRLFAALPAALVLASPVFAQGGGALPPVPAPPQNPITAEKAVLGKILFWDEQLSSDDTMSCGTCHLPQSNGADPRFGTHPGFDGIFGTIDDPLASPGVVHLDGNRHFDPVPAFGLDVQVTGRTAPAAFTSQWSPEQFWDGRAGSRFVEPESGRLSIPAGGSLESQAVGPITSTVEMGHDGRTWAEVAQKLNAARPRALAPNLPPDVLAALAQDPTYPALFARAFGSTQITAERIGFALATYERTLVADQTPWDRHHQGDPTAMTMSQRQGFQRFRQHQCDACHTPPLFTDHSYRVLGVRPWLEDAGRMDVTQNFADRGAFKVPSLRNTGLKPSFMHNGSMTNLVQVLDFYDHQIPSFPENQDPLYAAMSIPAADKTLMLDFLQNALTDPRVAAGLPPFDRPTLRSELQPNTIYGAGSPGGAAIPPRLMAHQPAVVGGLDFRIGVRDALGGTTALLAVSPLPATNSGLPVPIHVDLPASMLFTASTAGAGAADGYATFPLPLPNDTRLQGAVIYAQSFVLDPAAASGWGIAASDAVSIPVF
ncbi:MAG: cytochrome-c peroxidase [Planctomycetota bacterium]